MCGNPVQRVDLAGKRIITEALPYLQSVALGVFFKQGSRDDRPEQQGITHFTEHMFFKGTSTRSAKELSYCIETLGGMLDGFTSRETTGLYARFASAHSQAVIELLGDILSRPRFDRDDIAKEKEVVCEEIKSIEEDPSDTALELLLKAIYAPHPLSFPVTGSRGSIRNLSRDALVDHYRRHYGAERVLVVAVGDLRPGEIYDGIESNLVLPPGGNGLGRTPPQPPGPRRAAQFRSDLSQVYVGLGKPIGACNDDRRYALSLVNTALGGGLSSRLFQRLREEEGLVYSVNSFLELTEDSGVLGIFFITDKQKVSRVFDSIFEEIDSLRKNKLTERELEIARNLTTGSLLLSLENPLARMMRWARLELVVGSLVGIEEAVERYTRVSREEVDRLTDEIFTDRPFSMSSVGPMTDQELEKFLKEQA